MELQKLFVTLALRGQEFRQGMNDAVAAAQDLGSKVSGVFDKMRNYVKLAMAGVVAAVGAGFAMAIKSSIDVNAQLETTTLQFETLMGSADEAQKHVAGLFEFAEKTPFETEPIIQASLKLQTFGGEALNTMENLYLLGDAAAATNSPIDELGFWVGRLYSNLQAGDPFGEAAMRLQELAVMSPQARSEMERLQEAGASAAEVFAFFQKDLEKFSGAMEKQAETWQGLTATFKDQVSLLIAEALQPLFVEAKAGVEGLVIALNDPAVGIAIKGIATKLQELLITTKDVLSEVGKAFTAQGISMAIKDDLEKIGKISTWDQNVYYDLIEEARKELGVGFFDSLKTDEALAIHERAYEILQARYALELEAANATEASAAAYRELSEGVTWSGWASEEAAKQAAAHAEALTVVGDETESYASQIPAWSDKVNVMARNFEAFTAAISANKAEMEAAALATARYTEAFANVTPDYSKQLPGADQPLVKPAGFVTTITGGLDAEHLQLLSDYESKIQSLQRTVFDLENGVGTFGMTQEEVSTKVAAAREEMAYYGALMEPLAAQTGTLSTSQVGLQVNVGGVKQAIFDQLVQMGAAPEVIALYGVAIGVMTEQQAIAALTAAAVQIKIEELAKAIANGMPVEAALTDLDNFVTKIEQEMAPAAEQASIDIPEYITSMKELVGTESLAAGQALGDGLKQGIKETQDAALATAIDTAQSVISETKLAYGIESPSTVFSGIGGNLMFGLANGIEEQRKVVVSKVNSIGQSVINGLIAGIEAGKVALRGVLQGVADAIPDWLAQFLGIRSPARVTIPIGQAIVQGIVVGIEQESSLAENAAYMLALNLTSYFQEVIDGGDALNDWFTHLPEDMQPTILLISALVGEGNEYVASYFEEVFTSGDYMNDWLESFPEELRPFVEDIGQIIAEGMEELEEYFEYIGSFQHTLDGIDAMLAWADVSSKIASGFEKRFSDKVTDPLKKEIAALDEIIAGVAPMWQEVMGGVYSMLDTHEWTGEPIFGWDPRLDPVDPMADWTDPAQFQTALEQLFELFRKLSKTGLREEAERVSEAISALVERNGLNEEYIRQQEKILALENAKADLDYLNTQMELLRLFQDNPNLPSSLLEGVEFGLTADPETMMTLMVDVTERLIRNAQQEINQSMNGSPATSTQAGSLQKIENLHVQTQNINGGQHNYFGYREADMSELEALGVQTR